jgi:hypothetical protein
MQTNFTRNAFRFASLLVLSASLTACGGGGGTGGATSANATAPVNTATPATHATSAVPLTAAVPETPVTPPVSGATPPGLENHAPTISGVATTSVTSGDAYNFVPAAADVDGDNLQFAISSKPSWATFDATTGRLWGVPGSANLGSYEEIAISVTDGEVSTTLEQFAIVVEAATPATRNVHISWQPPTTNSDGSMLTDLNGYRILYGTQAGVYTSGVAVNNAGLASYTIEGLQSGKMYYIAMVSVNSSGAESDSSPELALDLL